MATQNLISATLPAEVKTDVLKRISEVKSSLSFLLTLQAHEIQGLFKAGRGFSPFIDRAHSVISAHPDIMPPVFDMDEFKRDYQLSKDLAEITEMIKELADALTNTQMAVNSDALIASLDVYSAVKQNRDRVPGLNVTAEEMGDFFKKNGKRKPVSTLTAN